MRRRVPLSELLVQPAGSQLRQLLRQCGRRHRLSVCGDRVGRLLFHLFGDGRGQNLPLQEQSVD
jgi:hypothetical protein